MANIGGGVDNMLISSTAVNNNNNLSQRQINEQGLSDQMSNLMVLYQADE